MQKVPISSASAPFPKPIVLVGANVDGQPNFMTVAWITRVHMDPNYWIVALNRKRHTLKGIRQNLTFSVNIPGTGLVEKVDYCGLHSGHDISKKDIFDVFYGDLGNAPMIDECPFCAELTVSQFIELPADILVVGSVAHAYAGEQYLTSGALDIEKLDPFIYDSSAKEYRKLGSRIGKAYSIGHSLESQGHKEL